MDAIPVALAIVAAVLMVLGALLMTAGDFGVAGALFLSASLVIYVRQRWV
jgi:membrane-bound ClpP family serine protease